jgi:hypothetical protein
MNAVTSSISEALDLQNAIQCNGTGMLSELILHSCSDAFDFPFLTTYNYIEIYNVTLSGTDDGLYILGTGLTTKYGIQLRGGLDSQ